MVRSSLVKTVTLRLKVRFTKEVSPYLGAVCAHPMLQSTAVSIRVFVGVGGADDRHAVKRLRHARIRG